MFKKLLCGISLTIFLCLTQFTCYSTKQLHISSPEDLIKFMQDLNSKDNFENYSVFLDNDIDLKKTEYKNIDKAVLGIGENSNCIPFEGKFDGKGHKIKSLNIDLCDENMSGFFRIIGANGEVQNLTIEGSVKGRNSIGAFAGENRGIIKNCINFANILPSSGCVEIGGISGRNYSVIENCINHSNIGKMGCAFNFKNAVPQINAVSGISCNYIGGIIIGCHNQGVIVGKEFVAGISGINLGTIKNCTNEKQITGKCFAGGISGANGLFQSLCIARGHSYIDYIPPNLAIKNINQNGVTMGCKNSGDIMGKFSSGGIVGFNSWNSLIKNCYNLGKISHINGAISASCDLGGIAGFNHCNDGISCYLPNIDGKIINCTNSSIIPCDKGIFGKSDVEKSRRFIYNCKDKLPCVNYIRNLCGIFK